MKLFLSAVTKLIIGAVFIGAMLFLPAWTIDYLGAWLFIAVLFAPMLILGAFLFIKSPDLLKKRLDSKEKEKTQKGVVALSGLMFPIGFIVSALDFRFGWSHMPAGVVIAASVVLLIAYALYAEVMRENAYLSRVVEVQEGQKVVDTGLYAVVRHPMYMATVFLFLSIPIVLGSWWALLCFLPYVPVIAARIKNEESVLCKNLEGYSDYQGRVRFKLIPFIW